MYNPYSLAEKTILVTGASSGIGRSTAIECSRLGAKVIVTGRNRERLLETYGKLEGVGHEQIAIDLSSEEGLETLVQSVPKLDGCVSNAGVVETIPLQFISIEKYDKILGINTKVPIFLTKLLIKAKKIKKGGAFVYTSSISGNKCAYFGNSLYSTSKAALEGFVKNAALDLAPKKIRVNSVMPGMIETELLSSEKISLEQLEEDRKRYPLKSYGKPKEVALAIAYLLSDAASWITGTSLLIDGGYSLT